MYPDASLNLNIALRTYHYLTSVRADVEGKIEAAIERVRCFTVFFVVLRCAMGDKVHAM